jgi:hypothetical protein
MRRFFGRSFGLSLAVAALAGCSANPVAYQGSAVDDNVIPVFGHLQENSEGDYHFASFTTDAETELNPGTTWVRLNDLHPMWNTAPETRCVIVPERSRGKEEACKSEWEAGFRVQHSDLSPAAMTSNILLTAVTLVGPAFSRPGYVEFDRDAYLDAVYEASDRIPDFERRMNNLNTAFNQGIGDNAAAYASYRQQDKPKASFTVDNQMPVIGPGEGEGATRLLDLMAEDLKGDFPQVTVSRTPFVPFGEAPLATTESFDELIASLKASIGAENDDYMAHYNVDCEKPDRSHVAYQMDCPDSVPADVDEVKVGLVVQGIKLVDVDLHTIQPTTINGVTVAFYPEREKQWHITNTSGTAIDLREMSIEYHRRELSVSLANSGVLSPGEDFQFNIDPKGYEAIKPDILIGERTIDRRISWVVRVAYQVQGHGVQASRYSGSHTYRQLAEDFWEAKSLEGDTSRPSIEFALNNNQPKET